MFTTDRQILDMELAEIEAEQIAEQLAFMDALDELEAEALAELESAELDD